MDITSIFFFVILIFICGFALGRYRRGIIENEGEGFIRRTLTSAFNSVQDHLLNNITIPIATGSTQIDHILVSTRGVFVIETKHYSGWIYANEKSAKWTQVIYKKKSYFQNPLRQNYLHRKTVEQLLDFLPKEAIHSVVVFTGPAEFKTTKPSGVFNSIELVKHIKSKPEGAISINRVAFCVGRLECARYQLSDQTDIEHQSHLIKKFGNAI
jgi:hypothetical protein